MNLLARTTNKFFTSLLTVLLIFLCSGNSKIHSTINARDLYQNGLKAMDNQSYFEAMAFFRQALDLNQNYAQALLKISEIYFLLGEYHEVINNLNLYDKFASTIDSKTLRARAHTGLGQGQQAKSIFKEILTQEPNNKEALFGMAEVNLLEGRSENAIVLIENMLKESHQNRRALLSLTLIFDDMQQFDRSTPHIKQAVFYFPQDPIVRFHAGLHYEKQRKWQEALNEYEAVYKINPNLPNLAQRRSQALMGLMRYDEAIKVLEELIKGRARENITVWSLLAEALERNNNLTEAYDAYIELLSLQPNHELHRLSAEDFVLRNYSIGSEERNKLALQRLEQAQTLYRSLDNYRALYNYRRVLMLNPYHAQTRFELGKILAQQGFPLSFIDQLRLLQRENIATKEMLTILEREERKDYPNPAKKFGLNHMPLGKTIKILVARINGASSLNQFGTDALLQQVFIDKLKFNTRFEVIDAGINDSESEIWHTAHNQYLDYSVVLKFIERERRLFAQADLYMVSTGTLIQSFTVNRTGNTRIEDATSDLIEMINNAIPMRTQIIRREGKRALIGVGSLHGVKHNDQFIIVNKGYTRFVSTAPYFEIINNSELGRLTIDDLGEFSSAGLINATIRPDVITTEDEVYLIKDPNRLPESSSPVLGIPTGFFLLN